MVHHSTLVPLLTLCILGYAIPQVIANDTNDSPDRTHLNKDYCVIGAGPSGLQMGYFLERAKRDYVIFERSNTSGAFYVKYPRHRNLISINKIYTGKTNKEFNFRHDWNSLISDDESLQMRYYSEEFFPPADDYVRYLQDYAKRLQLNIQYNTNIENIQRVANEMDDSATDHFTMDDKSGNTYTCRNLIVCTGIAKTNNPSFIGEEYTESYEDMSVDKNDYKGQSVLILGRGNSAFETADHLLGVTNVMHILARDRVRLSWATHYVGDLRAVNNGFLDTYMLKSMNALLEAGDASDMIVIKRSDGKLVIGPLDRDDYNDMKEAVNAGNKAAFNLTDRLGYDEESSYNADIFDIAPKMHDNFALRDPYDRIIKCLGFKFDYGLFNSGIEKDVQGPPIQRTPSRPGPSSAIEVPKYPHIKHNYESVKVPGLFFAGTNTHSLDIKKSAGGFIHGFRYTTRTLHRLLEWRNHQVQWPSVKQPITELINHIIKRINEASGTYQMFGVLADIVILRNNDTQYTYLEEFPVKLLHKLPEFSGHEASRVFVVSLEYGKNFSGPGADVFRRGRATASSNEANNSNFLHPIIYFYESLPTEKDMMKLERQDSRDVLPEPDDIHHMVEDFLTEFSAPRRHILVLRRFIESCLDEDFRYFFDSACFEMSLSHKQPPTSCQNFYLNGQGLPYYEEMEEAMLEKAKKMYRKKQKYGRKSQEPYGRNPRRNSDDKLREMEPHPGTEDVMFKLEVI